MTNIISFPNAIQDTLNESAKPVVSLSRTTNSQMHLGPWSFTCHKCNAKTSFNSENMIFRTVDFYCANCGSLHRVTNPAFTPNTK